MLKLTGIKKDYPAGAGVVHALRGIDLSFRRAEFVSILGPSGCGKTTLLNIIGGLDGYTEGDLVIDGVSTKEYKDRDWDTYRNHSVGFVFQSYNLIPHQTVLQNVELALTLSGVGKAERRERAIRALEEVGLGDQLKKRPAEMSGGQMQRVAIARALVNEPDIILADEPTGALDTETSVQVMEILKRVSERRLVVMVTHNPELADTYSSRIIRMLDGEIISDSAPLSEEEQNAEAARIAKEREAELLPAEDGKKPKRKRVKKPSMSFGTAFMLSLKNLFTKKGRTTLTAFAGSIGIIGIALILSVSEGTTAYIDYVQETTLSAYPLTLEAQTVDMSAMLESFMNHDDELKHDTDAVYKDPVIGEMVNALAKLETSKNDLAAFKTYLKAEMAKESGGLKDAVSGVQYTYAINPLIYTKNKDGEIIKSDTGELMTEMIGDFMMQAGIMSSEDAEGMMNSNPMMSNQAMMNMMGMQMWQELLPGLEDGDPINDMLEEQYDLVHGAWPNDKNEIVLVLNERNELDDLTLYALGLLSRSEIDAIIDAAASGKELPPDNKKWSYEEICKMTFRAVMPYDCYMKNGDIYVDMSEDASMLKVLYERALELKVVGIIRPNEDAEVAMLQGAIGYTHYLTEHVVNGAKNSAVVKAQLASPTVDVLTGLPFESTTETLTTKEKAALFREYVKGLGAKDAKNAYLQIQALLAEDDPDVGAEVMASIMLDSMSDEQIYAQLHAALVAQGTPPAVADSMLAGKTPEELRGMLRPGLQAQFKMEIDKITEYSFEKLVDMFLAIPQMNDKDALIAMISNFIVVQAPQMDVSVIAEMLGKSTLEDLQGMIRPSLEQQFKNSILELITSRYVGTSDEALRDLLRTEAEGYTEAECATYYDEVIEFSDSSYEENLFLIGNVDLDSPATINIYASSFENKDAIVAAIASYNDGVSEEKKIAYTDFLGIMMSSITTIINAITYVLIAFVSISLVVSSIMIGVITLISVQERTKEIGILRAIGASKRNVSSMFNAETMIVGFAAGLLGVLVTYILCIPINLILGALTGIAQLRAVLPLPAALILIAISVLLTLVAGLIPSRSAAKKDPVVALRTE